jgi:hypothetical protein
MQPDPAARSSSPIQQPDPAAMAMINNLAYRAQQIDFR